MTCSKVISFASQVWGRALTMIVTGAGPWSSWDMGPPGVWVSCVHPGLPGRVWGVCRAAAGRRGRRSRDGGSAPGKGEEAVGPHAVGAGSQVLLAAGGRHHGDLRAVPGSVAGVGLAALVLDPVDELRPRVVAGLAGRLLGPPQV